MYVTVSEIFDEFKLAEKKEKEIVLEKYRDHVGLKEVLRMNFDPSIKFVFNKLPKYKTENVYVGNAITNITNELKRFYIFIENDPKSINLKFEKKEIILKNMLESFDKGEGKVLGSLVRNKLKIPHLTEKIVEKVWPELLPKEEKEKEKVETDTE